MTAHIIKAALREAFPKTRFSVTRGGAWIKWTDDGPTVEQVQTTLIAANCVKVTTSWNGQQYFEASGNSNSIWFDCFNVAKRAADQADMARRIEEGEARRQRENEAVHAALQTKKAALARPSSDPKPIETAPETFQVFEQLRQRAERDVSTDAENNAERQRRPSCAWPLIISGEMLDICLELKLLKAGDPPIVRCWATFADPKKRGTVLREQRSSHPLIGIECRGFQLHAGAERGATSDILFEAQRDKDGTWRFGPRIHVYDYHSIHASKWKSKVREREKIQSGFYNLAPDSRAASLELIDKEIAEIDALDKAAAAKFYRRQQLQIRVVELARDRVLDFAGAPGVQMAMASRLCGFCFNCGKALTDPISLERGIGPDCLHGKIAWIWIDHDYGVGTAHIAFKTGMPEDFVTATLAAARPLYRTPLKHFPTGEFEDGRVIVYRRDGPGVIGIFNSRKEAWVWIDAQPAPASSTEAVDA